MTREQLMDRIRKALDDEMTHAKLGFKTHEAFLVATVERLFSVLVDALFEDGEQP